jgi:hypothetical protein
MTDFSDDCRLNTFTICQQLEQPQARSSAAPAARAGDKDLSITVQTLLILPPPLSQDKLGRTPARDSPLAFGLINRKQKVNKCANQENRKMNFMTLFSCN